MKKKKTDSYKCLLCNDDDTLSATKKQDGNQRKHIGIFHKKREFLYPSQIKQSEKKTPNISPEKKRQLDDAAIDCIVLDGRSFTDFKKPGMQKFLNIAVPGYVGPSRYTVSRRLKLMYSEYRKKQEQILYNVESISLTTD